MTQHIWCIQTQWTLLNDTLSCQDNKNLWINHWSLSSERQHTVAVEFLWRADTNALYTIQKCTYRSNVHIDQTAILSS